MGPVGNNERMIRKARKRGIKLLEKCLGDKKMRVRPEVKAVLEDFATGNKWYKTRVMGQKLHEKSGCGVRVQKYLIYDHPTEYYIFTYEELGPGNEKWVSLRLNDVEAALYEMCLKAYKHHKAEAKKTKRAEDDTEALKGLREKGYR